MKHFISLTAFLLLISMGLQAQSKSELNATIVVLNVKNDSLAKELVSAHELNTKQTRLIDTLSVMTGIQVSDLDTVKNILELRASAGTANTDSLTQARSHAAKLQLAMDSVSQAYTKLQADCGAARAAVASGTTGAVATDQVAQLMKLNGMLEQGLITKEEFLKMKTELMK